MNPEQKKKGKLRKAFHICVIARKRQQKKIDQVDPSNIIVECLSINPMKAFNHEV